MIDKMNPLTNMKNVLKLSAQELAGLNKTSWHDQYRDSAWLFVGGLPYDLTEGDVICIFSQYGEIVHLNLIRDKDTGKSRGFGFICYEDQRSTDLVVDNFNGIKILNRTIRVDHVSNYKVPKSEKDKVKQIQEQQGLGVADEDELEERQHKAKIKRFKTEVKQEPVDARETLADQIVGDIKLPYRLPIYQVKQEPMPEIVDKKPDTNLKKPKKEKKASKSSKKKKSRYSSCERNNSDSN